MSDDITFQNDDLSSPPDGTVIATDLAGSKHYQVVKLADGTADATTRIAAGGGVESSALRVTIASDSTGVLSVDDNGSTLSVDDGGGVLSVDDGGGSLTVDGTVGVSGTVAVSAASLPLPSGAATAAKQPALGVAGTASSDVISVQGIAAMTPLQVADNGGSLTVDGTVSAAQSGTWTVTGAGGTFPVTDSGGSLTVDGTVAATQSGTWTVTGTGGTFPVTDSGGSLTVDGTVAATQSGTWTVQPGNTANTTAWLVTGTGGTFPVTDSGGSLTVDGTVAATQSGTWTVTGTGGTFPVTDSGGSLTVDGTITASNSAGDVAHDSSDSGNPVKVGGKANVGSTPPSVVADADRANLLTDGAGRVVVTTAPRGQRPHATTTITGTSETTVLAAGASGVFHDLTSVMVANTSATAVRVDFKDATSGTIRFSVYAPAGQTVGIATNEEPIEQASAANNWTATASASVTDLRIFVKARATKG